MQEEVNEKTVSLCITGGKVTVRLLKQAMMRFLAAMEKEKAEKARKQQVKGPPDKDYHGKQSLKKLAQQNVQLSNIEITDNNIKAFEKVAKKYGIDMNATTRAQRGHTQKSKTQERIHQEEREWNKHET